MDDFKTVAATDERGIKRNRYGHAVPIEEDFSQPWVRGHEYICQEGTNYWLKQREARGWTHDEVHDLTDGALTPAMQMLIEGEYTGGWVEDVSQLVVLAVLYGRKPGEMLDECFETKGRELVEQEADDAVVAARNTQPNGG